MLYVLIQMSQTVKKLRRVKSIFPFENTRVFFCHLFDSKYTCIFLPGSKYTCIVDMHNDDP